MRTISSDEAIEEISEVLAGSSSGEWIAEIYTHVVAHPANYIGDSFIEVDDDQEEEDLRQNPNIWCLECKHPWLWHDENGCNTGSAGLDGGCKCETPKKKPSNK